MKEILSTSVAEVNQDTVIVAECGAAEAISIAEIAVREEYECFCICEYGNA